MRDTLPKGWESMFATHLSPAHPFQLSHSIIHPTKYYWAFYVPGRVLVSEAIAMNKTDKNSYRIWGLYSSERGCKAWNKQWISKLNDSFGRSIVWRTRTGIEQWEAIFAVQIEKHGQGRPYWESDSWAETWRRWSVKWRWCLLSFWEVWKVMDLCWPTEQSLAHVAHPN